MAEEKPKADAEKEEKTPELPGMADTKTALGKSAEAYLQEVKALEAQGKKVDEAERKMKAEMKKSRKTAFRVKDAEDKVSLIELKTKHVEEAVKERIVLKEESK